MKFLHQFLILCLAFSDNINRGLSISYGDLRELNATCFPDDSCNVYEPNDLVRVLNSRVCSCESICSHHGTCCIDSGYADLNLPKLLHTCRSTRFHGSYFMVDNCGRQTARNSVWERFCNEEWNGQDDDLMRIVPVTSLYTFITYKNFFCLRCHETTDNFLYWTVTLETDQAYSRTPDIEEEELTYNSAYQSWVVPLKSDKTLIPVNLTIYVPSEIWRLPQGCDAFLISRCSDMWTDDTIREKCNAYKAEIVVYREYSTLLYKNVHCALCNFEALSNMNCKYPRGGYGGYGGYGGGGYGYSTKTRISFKNLLHNPTDCGVNSWWDPKSEKCKRLSCVIPGYVIKGSNCVPPE